MSRGSASNVGRKGQIVQKSTQGINLKVHMGSPGRGVYVLTAPARIDKSCLRAAGKRSSTSAI